jgi:hypothetical protein
MYIRSQLINDEIWAEQVKGLFGCSETMARNYFWLDCLPILYKILLAGLILSLIMNNRTGPKANLNR